MNWKLCLLTMTITGLVSSAIPVGAAEALTAFQDKAGKFKATVSLPRFENSPEQVKSSVQETIQRGNEALDEIASLDPRKATFENTILAMDNADYSISLIANRLALIKESSTNAALRDAATEGLKTLEEWSVGRDYREDVYKVLKAYADKKPKLKGERDKLFFETMRDYRRAGLDLPKETRDEVERLRKQLANLAMDYESNINKAQKSVKFTKSELQGLPESFLEQTKTGGDEYTIQANVTWHYIMVMDNARLESTRRKLLVERDTMAVEENVPLLQKVLALRHQVATRLGYKTWADYVIEVKMARNADTAIDFLQKLKVGLQPKFDAELAEYRKLKSAETGEPSPTINLWDWRYFSNELKKRNYDVDAEQLRVYFPYDRVLEGMFAIYQSIFGLKFERVEAPYKWVADVQLYAVSDARTGEPMGLFYLDMFPREGKYNHFAVFPLIEGKLLPDGKYQRPVCAVICNFPAPTAEKPSLLSHSDVETLFHEFGHAMHAILTRAQFARFSGTSVPRDFVEAPSQMLENWVWDKSVLDSFAADYRDPSKKIPAEILGKLKEAKLATEGTRYRRQLSFGLTDLMLHTRIHEGNATEAVDLANKVSAEVFLPPAPGTAYVAYFGHLMGYDAGYYGYAWADAIAADMATVFEQSRKGYYDQTAGLRLREEIYAPGDSREVSVSIRKFLGRDRSLEPFFKKIGMGK